MNKKQTLLFLVAITFLGAILRFYSLGDNKVGFFRDEAALGFNTWSILKTGADEYGQKFPIILRSFEVFFLPAYVYLSLPIFYIFGINAFATRSLAAISGTLLIPIAFGIAQQLFKSKKVALIVALLVATCPWAIFYSRGAFEGNLALLFFSSGVYLWLRYLDIGNLKFFFLSIITFVLSMYSYQAPRLVAPLFIGLTIISQKEWIKKWKLWTLGSLFALLLYLPIALLSTSSAGYHRAVGVSIFSTAAKSQKIYQLPREILSLYFQYYSPNNLFSQNDYNPQRRVPNFSVFYLWQFPLLAIGLWQLRKKLKGNFKYLLIWLLIAPIPAALTRDPFHTYRALLVFLPLTIIIGFGFFKFLSATKKYKYMVYFIALALTGISVLSYFFSLQKTTAIVNWRDWDYGYDQVSEFIKSQPSSLRVVIDDINTTAYIHLLFYQVVPIREYQQAANTNGRYYTNSEILRPQKIGRFEFRKVDWPSERGDANTLFVFPANRLPPSEFSGDPKLKLEKTIFAPNGEDAFYIIRTLQ